MVTFLLSEGSTEIDTSPVVHHEAVVKFTSGLKVKLTEVLGIAHAVPLIPTVVGGGFGALVVTVTVTTAEEPVAP